MLYRFLLCLLVFTSSLFGNPLLEKVRPYAKKDAATHELLDALSSEGVVIKRGNDDFRVSFVPLQGAIEHWLACAFTSGEVKSLVGIIHTPMPTTPLCTPASNIDLTLFAPSIRHNAEKQQTVASRATILRYYLQCQAKLYVAYPKGGLEKRSLAQQTVYLSELGKHSNLIDYQVEAIDPNYIGATYLFETREGKLCAFSIKARQAKNPAEDSEWGLWFGELSNPAIFHRTFSVLHLLNLHPQSLHIPTP